MKHVSLDLWHNASAFLDLYLLDGENERPLVLIFPGGGYDHVSKAEGEPVAIRFNAAGYHAAVLRYRVKPATYNEPFYDAGKAIRHIRAQANLYRIDPRGIVVVGFSAGGHLAATLATLYNDQDLFPVVDGEDASARPDALLLAYPVISMVKTPHLGSLKTLLGEKGSDELKIKLSLETQIHSEVPPVFMWHTRDDESVSYQHSMRFYERLSQEQPLSELHIFSHGAHGMSLASEVENNNRGEDSLRVGVWVELAISWLKEIVGI